MDVQFRRNALDHVRSVPDAVPDILTNSEVGEQRVLLKKVTQRPFLGRDARPFVAIEENSSGRQLLQARDAAKNRCLSRTGRSEQNCTRGSMRDPQRSLDVRAAIIRLVDVGDQQQRATPFG